jgi:hypothetical protein
VLVVKKNALPTLVPMETITGLARFHGVLLAFDAATVAFGWLVAWIVVLVARWVRRGFAREYCVKRQADVV